MRMKKTYLFVLTSLLIAGCATPGTTSEPTSKEESSSIPPTSEESSSEDYSEAPSSEQEKLPAINYIKLLCLKEEFSYVYTWGGHTSAGWPGDKLTKTFDLDDRWYYYDVTSYSGTVNYIFNVGSDDSKTSDLAAMDKGYYFYYDGSAHKTDVLPSDEFVPFQPGTYDASLYRNSYQLLVYAFNDSNGDGIGDFKGIANKLDYLKDLGIETLWLSPIHNADSYHSYDVTDYYSQRSAYIVNGYDIEDLCSDAHAKGINIILDLVLNHTSSNCNWYSSHRDWYSGIDSFPGTMKDLDYDKTAVRAEIKNVGTYWLNKGVDGFRLDAAMWIYNNSDKSINHQKNFTWWNEWTTALKEVNANVYTIGEVLDSNHDLAYEYARSGLTSTFDFNSAEHCYNAVTNPSYDFVGKTNNDISKAKNINKEYILGRALSNHDIGRFSQQHIDMGEAKAYYIENNKEGYILANALNILMPGNTYLYYGDELGLKGTCPQGWNDMSYRTPMPFGTGRTISTKYFPANEYKGDGVTTSTTLSGNTAEQDASDSGSIYSALRALLNLKKDHPSIKYGYLDRVTDVKSALKGYAIIGNETINVFYNASSTAQETNITGTLLLKSASVTQSGNKITIPQYGYAVVKVK